MADWQVDLAAFSETSHTSRAVASIRSEFKAIGHRLAFGRPVDDKFPVRSTAGSFRGKSSGVAVSSRLPVLKMNVYQLVFGLVVDLSTLWCRLGTCLSMCWWLTCIHVLMSGLKSLK